MLKPCEKYSALPAVRHGLIVGHSSFWPASESRYCTTVPRWAASSRGNSVWPGTQPSCTARSHDCVFSRWPTITLTPLSFMLSDWPRPCTP